MMAGQSRILNWIKFSALIVVMILFVFPFVLLIVNSFKANQAITSDPLGLPSSFQFDNYVNAFDKMGYVSAFSNSLLITIAGVLLIALFAAMTAHYFVRHNSKVNQYLFFLMVAAMIIPFQAIMIPLVKIYGSLSLLDNKWSLIYMYIGFGSPLAVFIYHGFIKSIPLELEEAALMDGCGRVQTFFESYCRCYCQQP